MRSAVEYTDLHSMERLIAAQSLRKGVISKMGLNCKLLRCQLEIGFHYIATVHQLATYIYICIAQNDLFKPFLQFEQPVVERSLWTSDFVVPVLREASENDYDVGMII